MTIIPLLIFVVGWGHVQSTWQWSNWEEKEAGDIKVINFNVRVFNVYDHDKDYYDTEIPGEMMDWLAGQDADILSLQEYYNVEDDPLYRTREILEEKGFKHSFVLANKHNGIGAQFGLAIFSKFPIASKGSIPFPHEDHNTAIFCDVVVGSDTLRMYNVHLYSMKIRMKGIEKDMNSVKETITRMKGGFQAHAIEVALLRDHMKASPFPIIIAGDFNELPYGYSYITFKEFLQNSFEEKGKGFGFTYAYRPSFIRIDHQFSSSDLRVKSHEVHQDVNYSDHFPVSVVYRLEKK